MFKRLLAISILIALTVSCASANQPKLLPSATHKDTSTATNNFAPMMMPLQTPSLPSDEPKLVFFVSEQGKFTAWMPVAGDIVEYTIRRAFFAKSIECSIVGFSLNSAGATVQYCDWHQKTSLHSQLTQFWKKSVTQ